jgi:hypothetical protein
VDAAAPGEVVYVPSGDHRVTEPVLVRSDTTLVLDPLARIIRDFNGESR